LKTRADFSEDGCHVLGETILEVQLLHVGKVVDSLDWV
jgi:hypothetical protein